MAELQRIKEEVAAREEQQERERQERERKAQQELREQQAKLIAQQESSILNEKQVSKDHTNANSVLNLQDFLQNSPQIKNSTE